MSLISRPEKSRIRIRIIKTVLGICGQHWKYDVEGGTYHDSATLVGDVPDLEARKEQDPDPEGSVRNPRIRIRTKLQH
jgi:hypothetical protein